MKVNLDDCDYESFCLQACAQLVRPLLAMNHLLQRQAMELEDLLVRKDAEIQDYKENGASLSRGTHTCTWVCVSFHHGFFMNVCICNRAAADKCV